MVTPIHAPIHAVGVNLIGSYWLALLARPIAYWPGTDLLERSYYCTIALCLHQNISMSHSSALLGYNRHWIFSCARIQRSRPFMRAIHRAQISI